VTKLCHFLPSNAVSVEGVVELGECRELAVIVFYCTTRKLIREIDVPVALARANSRLE